MAKIKVLRKEISAVTNAWVDSSLQVVDNSTGAVSTVYPQDYFEIDTSIFPHREKYERPDTHLYVDSSQLDMMFESKGKNIWEVRNQEIIDQVSSSKPYLDLYDKINKAIEKFNS